MSDAVPQDPLPAAADAHLFVAVYAKLREIAAHQLVNERRNHTLQATALVHEAWLKLGGEDRGGERLDRGAFLAAAAQAMRQILIDHARGQRRHKRGGGMIRVPLDPLELAARGDPHDIVALDECIDRLAARDPRLAELAKLRIYAGLSAEEAAQVLGVHGRTARRDWQLVQAFLHRALNAKAAES